MDRLGRKGMNCPRCGNTISPKRNRCEICGMDLKLFRKAYLRSNLYYNRGLEKANVRDLSGAVLMLKQSLELNKSNTNARNLLGLIYFEMGETVAALSEWVISKHFQPDQNDADRYMEQLQSDQTKLEAFNQAIKKYNLALQEAKNGDFDLAMLQLKKVINLNPNFIRALQLLALLYMKERDYEKAKRCLLKAGKIDIANTNTLRYLNALPQKPVLEKGTVSASRRGEEPIDSTQKIEPVNNYREDKPNIMAWVNLFLGMAVGIAFTFLLIVPTAKANIREEYEKEKMDYNSDLMVQMAAVTSRDKEIASLQQKLEDKDREIEELKVPQNDLKDDLQNYDAFLEIMTFYLTNIGNGLDSISNEQLIEIASKLSEVDEEALPNEEATKILEQMRESVYKKAAVPSYKAGRSALDKGDYEEALSMLLLSRECNPERDDMLYYLGKAYQAQELFEEAKEVYNTLLENFPNSKLKEYTRIRLGEVEAQIKTQ